MGLLDYAKKKKDQLVGVYKNDASTLGIAKNTVKGLGSALNQVVQKGPAAAYYDANPKAAINVNRATAFRMPEELAGNLFSGVKDFTKTAGGAIGEGLAYAIDPEVRKQYQAGNTDILPTVSKVSPLQMIGKTTRAGLEVYTPKFLQGAAKAKALPTGATNAQRLFEYGKRAAVAAPAGYAYDVSNRIADGANLKEKSTYTPGVGTAVSALFGAGMKPAAQMYRDDKTIRPLVEIAKQVPQATRNSIRNRRPGAITQESIPAHWVKTNKIAEFNPATGRIAGNQSKVRGYGDTFDNGFQTRGQKVQQRLPEQVVERGRKTPTVSDLLRQTREALPRPGMSIQAVDDPLLSEARKYKTPEEFVSGTKDSIKKVPLTGNSRKYLSELFQVGDSNIYIGYKKTGKVSDVMRDVVDSTGKSTGKMRSETPEIDFRVFRKEDGFSAENGFIKAQRNGTGGVTTLDELPKALKSQLTDLWKKAQGGSQSYKVAEDTTVKTPEVKVDEPSIKKTEPEDPLLQEAKKYKNAEEFVKAQGTPVYHGTSGDNALKISQEGFKVGAGKGVSGQAGDFIFTTHNKQSAARYVSDRLGIKNPTVLDGSFNGKILEIQGKMADFEAFGEASKKLGVPLGIGSQGKPTMLDIPAIQKAMKEQGYGAIQFSDRYANGSKALAILPDQIKTKSQLIDIWKQAHGENKTPKEATKIKTEQKSDKPNKSGLVKTLEKTAEKRGVKLKKEEIPRLSSKMKMDDETKKAFKFYAEDPQKAIEMAIKGEAPEGVRVGKLYTAVRDTAIVQNDFDTLYRLRSSGEAKRAIEAAAEAGRDVKAYDSAIMSDPAKIMRQVDDLKKEIAEKSGIDIKKDVKNAEEEIATFIEKNASTDADLSKLVQKITC